jgi:hypothetical protein
MFTKSPIASTRRLILHAGTTAYTHAAANPAARGYVLNHSASERRRTGVG